MKEHLNILVCEDLIKPEMIFITNFIQKLKCWRVVSGNSLMLNTFEKQNHKNYEAGLQ